MNTMISWIYINLFEKAVSLTIMYAFGVPFDENEKYSGFNPA
jgi:hypothetical protein